MSVLVDTQASSVAGIITALGTFCTAVGAVWLAWRQQQISREAKKIAKVAVQAAGTLETVHTIVNQKFTDQQRYIIGLREQVIRLGGDPIIDQSQPVTGQPDAKPGQPMADRNPDQEAPRERDDDRPPLVMKEVREDPGP